MDKYEAAIASVMKRYRGRERNIALDTVLKMAAQEKAEGYLSARELRKLYDEITEAKQGSKSEKLIDDLAILLVFAGSIVIMAAWMAMCSNLGLS